MAADDRGGSRRGRDPSLAVPALWIDLGEIEYGAAHALQLDLVARRLAGEMPDLLLLCQHRDVITVGRRQRARANIREQLFPLHEVERGGDVTYHGPGQLVGYPILLLEGAERDLHRYLRNIEEGLIAACAACGVMARRIEGKTGVWTAAGERKLASIGVAVRRWITFHGFALNVSTDLGKFAAINPCGFAPEVMTSLAAEGGNLGGAPPSLMALNEIVAAAMGAALGRRFERVLLCP